MKKRASVLIQGIDLGDYHVPDKPQEGPTPEHLAAMQRDSQLTAKISTFAPATHYVGDAPRAPASVESHTAKEIPTGSAPSTPMRKNVDVAASSYFPGVKMYPGGEVVLSKMALSDDDADAILNLMVTHKPLTKLVLADNLLGDGAAAKIAVALTKDTSLRYLSLHRNCIGEAGGIAIAKALRINTTLQTLFLTSNEIGEGALAALADANHSRPQPMQPGLSGLMTDAGCL